MTPTGYKSLNQAICAAYTPGSYESHQVIVMSHGSYFVAPKNTIPPGYQKLKLNEITLLLNKEFDNIRGADKKKLADALGYMGNRQVKMVFSGCLGFLRKILWFFQNLFKGQIGKMPATKAFELQNRLMASAPASALRKELLPKTEPAPKAPATQKGSVVEVIRTAPEPKGSPQTFALPPIPQPIPQPIPNDAFNSDLIILRKKGEETQKYNVRMYENTVGASLSGGYCKKGQYITIDNSSMLTNTQLYGKDVKPLAPLDDSKKFKTTFNVILDDTLNVLLAHKRKGANPVGLVLANPDIPGGYVQEGHTAQEEDICRRSSLETGLSSKTYPLPEFGGIYCPDVPVFRDDILNGYAFMDKPETICFVAAAAYDLRQKTTIQLAVIDKDKNYVFGTGDKIGNMLRTMSSKGHDTLVLGAFGCGVFNNNPKIVSTIFQHIFDLPEFKGRFKQVDFAILSDEKSENVRAFRAMCEKLNKG